MEHTLSFNSYKQNQVDLNTNKLTDHEQCIDSSDLNQESSEEENKEDEYDVCDEENLNLLREKFSESVESGDAHRAYRVLKSAIISYPHLLEYSQKTNLIFTLMVIHAIDFDNKRVKRDHGEVNLLDKNDVYEQQYHNLMQELKKYIQLNHIDLDDITIVTCCGFDASLLKLTVQLSTSTKMLMFLVSEGINVNIADAHGDTLLHILATLPETVYSKSIVNCLLEHGIDIHAINHVGKTPLLCTISANALNMKIIKLLLKNGAQINSTDNEGNTLLHIVCSLEENNQRVHAVQYLMDHRATISAKNNRNLQPIDVAKIKNNKKIEQFLAQHSIE